MYRSRTTIEEGNGTHNEDQKRESGYKAGCLQITIKVASKRKELLST